MDGIPQTAAAATRVEEFERDLAISKCIQPAVRPASTIRGISFAGGLGAVLSRERLVRYAPVCCLVLNAQLTFIDRHSGRKHVVLLVLDILHGPLVMEKAADSPQLRGRRL